MVHKKTGPPTHRLSGDHWLLGLINLVLYGQPFPG